MTHIKIGPFVLRVETHEEPDEPPKTDFFLVQEEGERQIPFSPWEVPTENFIREWTAAGYPDPPGIGPWKNGDEATMGFDAYRAALG